MAGMKGTGKSVHRTASPYRIPEVPKLDQPYHNVATDLLVSLLRPLGARQANPKKSKGKKTRKRKRAPPVIDEGHTATPSDPLPESQHGTDAPASPPPVRKHLLLGFNEVTRHLEDQSPPAKQPSKHVAVMFLLRSLDELIYSHFPALCFTASKRHPGKPATRLVVLDPSVEKQVAEALGELARVSVLAVLEGDEDTGVPGLQELVSHVRTNLKPVEVPWLQDAIAGKWAGTRIVSQ